MERTGTCTSGNAGTGMNHRNALAGGPAGWVLLSGIAAALVLGFAIASAALAAKGPAFPSQDLVRLDNPARAAILRHDLRAALDPATNHLSVVDTVTVRHAPGVPLSEPVPVLLWKGLTVESVEGIGLPARFESADGMTPRSFWKNPPYDELGGYEAARQVRVWCDRGANGGPGKDSGKGTLANWPETARLIFRYSGTVMDSLRPPKQAYSRSFEETAGLITQQGAFLCGASFWIPSRPEEVFTFRCSATVPAGWHAVSQGRFLGTAAGTAAGTDSWDCPQPMEEIYIVAGPWALHQRNHKGVLVQAFTYANTDSTIYNRYLDGTGRYLDLYNALIGPYPFAKFALVENFWQTGFGMPSFTLLGDRVIRLPFILDTSYGHEILHNWWGNGVFVKAEEGNWCEGLTTYGADYLYKARESAEAARQYRLNALSGYLDYVSAGEDIPLSEFRGRSDAATQAIGYSKSMMVLHQLRRQVGEQKFWKALQRFYRVNLWHRASWTDLLESFRKVGGIDPDRFRAQWIERTGAPKIAVSDVAVRPAGKGWVVSAKLAQTLPDGSRNGTPFDLSVPVRVRWAGGEKTWQVPLKDWESSWSVPVDARPQRLVVDPDFDMMRRIDRGEIPPTLSRVLGSDSVTVVLASTLDPEMEKAARDLCAEWAKGETLRVVTEAGLPENWTPPTNAWYIGLGPAARRLISGLAEARARGEEGGSSGDTGGGWTLAGREFPGTSGIIMAGSYPDRPDRDWAAIVTTDSAQLRAIAAKVGHYGRYSYLVFDGSKNVGQGVWSETRSPLTVDLNVNP